MTTLLFIGGLIGLIAGAELLVRGASRLALSFGISPLVVGLTIVAFGTSSPEMAVSTSAVLSGQTDIAIGNVVGSCTFKILGCLGLAGIVSGASGLGVPSAVLNFDIWVMLAVAVACLPVFLTGREIARWEGAVFLLYYAACATYLILAAQDHAALGTFSTTMMGFVIPITVITLVVALIPRGQGETRA